MRPTPAELRDHRSVYGSVYGSVYFAPVGARLEPALPPNPKPKPKPKKIKIKKHPAHLFQSQTSLKKTTFLASF